MCDFPRDRTTRARPSFSPLGYSVTSARTRSPGSAEKSAGRSTSRSRSDSRSRNRTKKRFPVGAYRPTNVRIPRSRIRSTRPYDGPPARRRSSRTSTRSLGHAPERECPGIRTMGVSGSAGITIGRPSRVKRRRPSTVRTPVRSRSVPRSAVRRAFSFDPSLPPPGRLLLPFPLHSVRVQRLQRGLEGAALALLHASLAVPVLHRRARLLERLRALPEPPFPKRLVAHPLSFTSKYPDKDFLWHQ